MDVNDYINYHSRKTKKNRSRLYFLVPVGAVLLAVLVIVPAKIMISAKNDPPIIVSPSDDTEPVIELVSPSPEVPDADKEAIVPAKKSSTSDWNLILVNKWNYLPENYSVSLESLSSGEQVDERIIDDLNNMLSDAEAEGLSPIVCSSYRTFETQTVLYENKVNAYISEGMNEEEAEEEAGKWVAVPGTSEHHTGLAVDIVALSYQLLDEAQEDTAEQQWLMANSYKYGFILRYPNGKTTETGILYEPWHYRYVGKDAAAEIFAKGITLEEYIESLR